MDALTNTHLARWLLLASSVMPLFSQLGLGLLAFVPPRWLTQLDPLTSELPVTAHQVTGPGLPSSHKVAHSMSSWSPTQTSDCPRAPLARLLPCRPGMDSWAAALQAVAAQGHSIFKAYVPPCLFHSTVAAPY